MSTTHHPRWSSDQGFNRRHASLRDRHPALFEWCIALAFFGLAALIAAGLAALTLALAQNFTFAPWLNEHRQILFLACLFAGLGTTSLVFDHLKSLR